MRLAVLDFLLRSGRIVGDTLQTALACEADETLEETRRAACEL